MSSKVYDHPLYLFKDFRKLFGSRLISAIGDKFFTISIAWFILAKGGASSKIQLGIMMATNLLPIVLFGPLMGTLADKLNRKVCLVIADFIRAVLMAGFAIAAFTDNYNMTMLYLLCFCSASFTPLFEAAASSSLVDLTDEENVSKAVAVDAMTVQLSNVLGALLGGIFIASFGVSVAFMFNSITFILSMLLVLSISSKLEPKSSTDKNYWKQVREGFEYIISDRAILSLVIIFTVFNFFAAPLIIMIPMIVKFILNEAVQWVAGFESVIAIGSVLMSIILSFKSRKRGSYRNMFLGMFLVGLSTLLIGLVKDKYIMCILLFLIGICLSLVNAIALSIFQDRVPDKIKGRFFALLTTACFSVMPLAYVLNAFLTQYFSLSFILMIEGSASVIISFIVLLIPRINYKLGGSRLDERTEEVM